MVLFLGVCKGLKAMHQYRVQGGPGGATSLENAKRARAEAANADAEAAQERRQRVPEADLEDEQQEPLMDGEVTRSQEGVAPGEVRAYAHRDIKPGKWIQDIG